MFGFSGSDYFYIRRILHQVYLDSFVSVVTEPQYGEDELSVFCSEKIFKSIACLHPFIIVGGKGSLKRLRQLGYKTFDGFIDESYDKESDSTKRMAMVAAEVKRLCSMSKEEIHNWYWSMEEILYHNRERTLNIHKDEPYSLEFIKYLVQKVS